MWVNRTLALAAVLSACGGHPSAPVSSAPPVAAPAAVKARSVALPGAPADGVMLDYIVYEPVHHRVWVPAGGTGKVDVIDARTLQVTPIDGFPTKEFERRGQKRTIGPSAAAVGDGVVYIGNRGDASVCAYDSATLAKRTCATLDSPPDGIQYVAATKEIWVTTPHDKAIAILDAATLAAKAGITFAGEPEGFAVDEARGVFYTNLEDKDQTLAIDVRSHHVTQTWNPACGEDGPKGLIFDAAANHLVVVCPDHIETLDPAHDGAVIGKLAVGDGLDNIDYVASRHQLVLAAGRAATLVVGKLGADGSLTAAATIPTVKGARNAVIADDGTMFVCDGHAGAILVVPPVP